jgi:hypothetical protein
MRTGTAAALGARLASAGSPAGACGLAARPRRKQPPKTATQRHARTMIVPMSACPLE